MNAAGTLVLITGFLLFTFTMATAGQGHKIPDAPPEYLALVNPINDEEVDEKFLKKAGKLYKRKCRKCHGEKGDGKGPNAENFVIMPAAFSTPGYLATRKDGQLFWIMMNGSDGTEMAPVGPDSDVGLSEEKLWQLIVYLRRTFTN
jgi:mono/diheme cytochrome c family protein